MRTTINLPDALGEAARAKAAAEGRTFTSVVEEALRGMLQRSDELDTLVVLPAHGDPSERPLVDLTDKEALWAVLDADGPR